MRSVRDARSQIRPGLRSALLVSASEAAAVRTAKTFVLAVLYAGYTGGRDHRWTSYVSSGRVRAGLDSTLAAPGVTTESFTGTARFWPMHAVATGGAGARSQ